MELRINLATASLKDAEHAIFIIAAYFGLTQSGVGDVRVIAPDSRNTTGPVAAPQGDDYLTGILARDGLARREAAPATGSPVTFGRTQDAILPTVFDTAPVVLPPGAGEAPSTLDPAAVFAGNGGSPAPAAPQGIPGMPTASNETGAPPAPIAAAPVGTPPAPTHAPAASAPPAASVDLDIKGLPWDGRIHASGEGGTKPKTADGAWRKRRGVQPLDVSRIEAQLRASLAVPSTPPAPPQAPTPTPPPAVPPAPPQAPAQPPAAPDAPLPDPTNLEQLMPRVTAAIMAGHLPGNALATACTAYQIANVPMLGSRPDAVPAIWTYLRSMYPALK